MIIQNISKLPIIQSRLCLPFCILVRSNQKSDPCAKIQKKKTSCSLQRPPGGQGGGRKYKPQIVRALNSGKCRMGFIPEEWFTFFSTKTGVTGPYFLILGLTNYVVSKEIFVMEHEYYSGISVLLVLYLVTTKFGSKIGAALDVHVDEILASFQKVRDADKAHYKNVIKECELSQVRAKGQKELMAAKKENIALQLEAAYRERVMMVHKTVKGRMEYHIRRHRIVSLIEQRWILEWLLKKVHESMTPEFRKKAFQSAIQELEVIASKIK